ncbi:MAG: hypothetical protein Q9212_006110 [Teloschistes hypoglaucus]
MHARVGKKLNSAKIDIVADGWLLNILFQHFLSTKKDHGSAQCEHGWEYQDERLTKDKEDVEGKRDDLKVQIKKVENDRQEASSAKDDTEKKQASMELELQKTEELFVHFFSSTCVAHTLGSFTSCTLRKSSMGVNDSLRLKKQACRRRIFPIGVGGP